MLNRAFIGKLPLAKGWRDMGIVIWIGFNCVIQAGIMQFEHRLGKSIGHKCVDYWHLLLLTAVKVNKVFQWVFCVKILIPFILEKLIK